MLLVQVIVISHNSLNYCAVDFNFTRADLNEALDCIRFAAHKYDPTQISLSGFMGADMSPASFKDMMHRTFRITLTSKQLGSLIKYFG